MPDGTTPTNAANDKRLVQLIDQVSERLNRGEVGDALGLLAGMRVLAAEAPPTDWEEIEARIQLQRIEVLGAYAVVAVTRDALDSDVHFTLTTVLDDACARLDKAAWKMDEITKEAKEAAGKAAQTPDPRAGFEHCPSCEALLRDRGETVGRHLSDCAVERQEAQEPAETDEPDNRYVARLMNDNACRVHEALGVLRLASNLLMEGHLDLEEQGSVMSAIDAAERVLEPLTIIGDSVALRQAAAQLEAKDKAEAA